MLSNVFETNMGFDVMFAIAEHKATDSNLLCALYNASGNRDLHLQILLHEMCNADVLSALVSTKTPKHLHADVVTKVIEHKLSSAKILLDLLEHQILTKEQLLALANSPRMDEALFKALLIHPMADGDVFSTMINNKRLSSSQHLTILKSKPQINPELNKNAMLNKLRAMGNTFGKLQSICDDYLSYVEKQKKNDYLAPLLAEKKVLVNALCDLLNRDDDPCEILKQFSDKLKHQDTISLLTQHRDNIFKRFIASLLSLFSKSNPDQPGFWQKSKSEIVMDKLAKENDEYLKKG